MLALHPPPTTSPARCHLLPCKIAHTGPVDASPKHWEVSYTPTLLGKRKREAVVEKKVEVDVKEVVLEEKMEVDVKEVVLKEKIEVQVDVKEVVQAGDAEMKEVEEKEGVEVVREKVESVEITQVETKEEVKKEEEEEEGEKVKTAYFRGRKLLGLDLPLPEGYTGTVFLPTSTLHATTPLRYDEDEDEDMEDEDSKVETTIFQGVTNFEEVTVWGHEEVPRDEEEDVVRGLREWMGFAERVHSWEDEE